MIKYPSHYYILFLLTFVFSSSVEAKRPEFHLNIKNHLFYPAKIIIPAHKKVKLVIHNHDSSVEEFDSFDLNREKVIFSGQVSTIYIGPLPVGEYQFFGEYHPNSARGKVIVKLESDSETSDVDMNQGKGSRHVN